MEFPPCFFQATSIMLRDIILVMVGSGIGGALRYLTSLAAIRFLPSNFVILSTLTVNILGSFLLGIVLTSTLFAENNSLRLFVAIGFCGGFTTFSTFSAEAVALLQRGEILLFGGYVLLNVALSLSALWLGYYLAK